MHKKTQKEKHYPFSWCGHLVAFIRLKAESFLILCCILPLSFSSFLFRHFNLKFQFFLRVKCFTIFSSYLEFSNYETSKDSEKDWHTSFPPSLFISPSFRGVKIQIVFLYPFFFKLIWDLGKLIASCASQALIDTFVVWFVMSCFSLMTLFVYSNLHAFQEKKRHKITPWQQEWQK